MTNIKPTSFSVKGDNNISWLKAQSDRTKSLNILIQLAIANFGYVDIDNLYQEVLLGLINNTKLETTGIVNNPKQSNDALQMINLLSKNQSHPSSDKKEEKINDTTRKEITEYQNTSSDSFDEEHYHMHSDNKKPKKVLKNDNSTKSTINAESNESTSRKRDELLRELGIKK